MNDCPPNFCLIEPMVPVMCLECGVHFMVGQHLYAVRVDRGKAWYCPNGHRNRTPRAVSTDAEDSLARRLEVQEAELRDARSALAAAAEKSVVADFSSMPGYVLEHGVIVHESLVGTSPVKPVGEFDSNA